MRSLYGILLIIFLACISPAAVTEMPMVPVYKTGAAVIRPQGGIGGFVNPIQEQEALAGFFNFTNCTAKTNCFIRYDFRRKLSGMPKKIIWDIWAKKQMKGLVLSAWFLDKSGEVYLSRKRIDWDGWKKVEFTVPKHPAWRGGDQNGKIDLPLKILGIGIDKSDSCLVGEIRFGKSILVSDLNQGNPYVLRVKGTGYIWKNNKVKIDTYVDNYAKKTLSNTTANLTITNRYSGKKVWQKKLTFGSGNDPHARQSVTPTLPYGPYFVDIKLNYNGKEVDSLRTLLQLFMGDCSTAPKDILKYEQRWSPMGGVWGFMSAELASQFGARWDRLESPNWGSMEREKGQYNTDLIVKAVEKRDRSKTRSVILQARYCKPKFYVEDNLPEFCRGYGMMMKQEAAALKGLTQYFELGNEDNGHSKFMYTEMGRNGAAGIRSEQPFAIISNSGTASVDYSWLKFQANRNMFNYFDALCVHPYTNNSTASQSVSAEKSRVLNKLEALNELVDAYGGMKELWTTEFGWPNGKGKSNAKNEHDRATLYLREVLLCDAAGYQLDGIYTFKRDYGIVDFPAGPPINAYSNFRQGHRFAGMLVDKDIWTSVYQKGDTSYAVVWTPGSKSYPLNIKGKKCHDMFGNPIDYKKAKISYEPLYITGVDGATLKKVIAAECEKKKKFFKNCLKTNPSSFWNSLGSASPTDVTRLKRAIIAWTKQNTKVSGREKALVGRVLDWYLTASRLPQTWNGKTSFAAEKLKEQKQAIMSRIVQLNENDLDVSGVRYLLHKLERINDDRELAASAGQDKFVAACLEQAGIVTEVAESLINREIPFQYAVFSMLYSKTGKKLVEKLSIVPNSPTSAKVRVTSYSKNSHKVKITPVLPKGWKCKPASAEVELDPVSVQFVDFTIIARSDTKADQLKIKLVTSIKDKPANISIIDDIKMVPAVNVELNTVYADPSKVPVKILVSNQENKAISGIVRLRPASRGGKPLAQFAFNKLKPLSKTVFKVKLNELPAFMHPDWKLIAEIILSDNRKFSVPAKLDYTTATPAENVKIDADLSEWKNALPLKIDQAEYAFGSYGGAWSPEDCSADSFLMWDNDYLYFAAAVKDQTFNQLLEGDSTWKQDSIQLIFAGNRKGPWQEFTLALTPKGPQVWNSKTKNFLKGGKAAIVYDKLLCCYEIAIPWSEFKESIRKSVEKQRFLYGIAINDDDVIGSRHFMERFNGSIIHGKSVKTFAWVKMLNADELPKLSKTNSNDVFLYDFEEDATGKTPLGWKHILSRLPNKATLVAPEKGKTGNKVLLLNNSIGNKAYHFSALSIPLETLTPGKRYNLQFRVKGQNKGGTTIGVCSDALGNKDFRYAKWKPSNQWQTVNLSIGVPKTGHLNLIIRNNCLSKNFMIDDIRITPMK